MSVTPGLGFWRAMVMTQATTAVANTVPGGSAIGIGMTYGMLGSWGYSRSRTTTAVLVSGVWNSFDYTEEVRSLQVPTLIVAADADMAPPSHYVEVFKLLDGGLRDGGWMGEGRPKGGHALAILPDLTHYNMAISPLFAAVTLAFLDEQPS
jgi:pimeloyl-ACP methyl ester carboxylesterase